VTDIQGTRLGAEAWASPANNEARVPQISGEMWISRASIPTEIIATRVGVEMWQEHGFSPGNRIMVPQMSVEVWVSSGPDGAGTPGRRRILMAEY
jgi:hypothetical protein